MATKVVEVDGRCTECGEHVTVLAPADAVGSLYPAECPECMDEAEIMLIELVNDVEEE